MVLCSLCVFFSSFECCYKRSVPILYGSVATKVANASKLHPEHTHTWDVYVKCPNDRDLGKIVKKVVFKLHDSFTHPNRSKFLFQ